MLVIRVEGSVPLLERMVINNLERSLLSNSHYYNIYISLTIKQYKRRIQHTATFCNSHLYTIQLHLLPHFLRQAALLHPRKKLLVYNGSRASARKKKERKEIEYILQERGIAEDTTMYRVHPIASSRRTLAPGRHTGNCFFIFSRSCCAAAASVQRKREGFVTSLRAIACSRSLVYYTRWRKCSCEEKQRI